MKYPQTHSARGFSFVEMLVVIALVSLLMFLIYRLFFDSLQVISRGVALSDIHISARTLGEAVEEDGKAMRGPADATPGFLVILQHEYVNLKLYPDDATTRNVRSDQLLFFRDTGNIAPVVPGSQATLLPPSVGSTEVRIWYGHAQRTGQDGLDDGVLGAAGANLHAGNWILARQAMFLVPLHLANFRSATAVTNAPVLGYVAGNGFPAIAAPLTYHGLNDLAATDLNTITTAILPLTYTTSVYPYTYGANRLRANSRPLWDSNAANNRYTYASWQLAQMHPVFVPNVSDFVVDFAGDYDGVSVGSLDMDVNGNIKWYSHYVNDPSSGTYNDQLPDTYAIPTTVAPFSRPTLTTEPHYDTAPGLANATAAIVFRHDDPANWPYLIRLRARVHDINGNFVSTDRNVTTGDAATPGVWYESIVQVNRN